MKQTTWHQLLSLGIFGLTALHCGGESNSSTVRGMGGSSSSGGHAHTGGSSPGSTATPCLRACTNLQKYCGDPSCSILCGVLEDGLDVPLCPVEAKSFFDCIASLGKSSFNCLSDAGDPSSQAIDVLMGPRDMRPSECDSQLQALLQCGRTQGADCAAQPAFDDSCTLFSNDHPNFQFCKLDVTAPSTCVPYDVSITGWYCCK